VAAVFLTPAEAAAEDDVVEILGPSFAIAVALGDLAFFTHALVGAAVDQPMDRTVSIAQASFSAPQVLGFSVGMLALPSERDGAEILAGVAPFGMVANTLFVHGVWTAARPDHDVRKVFAASSVIGINAGWTHVIAGYLLVRDMVLVAL